MRIRRLLSEPLLHFLLLGGALFAIYGWMATGRSGDNQIVITSGVMDDLLVQYQARWGKSPTEAELNGLVDAWVRDEILYREGVTLGLDRDDLVVKRRVRQKFEVMAEEELSSQAPTDADLEAFLAANPAKFTQPAILSFEQIFLGVETSGPAVQKAVARTHDAVRRGTDPSVLGESTLLPARMMQTPADLVAREFGEPFTTSLEAPPLGQWAGPVGSAFGAHLVRVVDRKPAVMPHLADVHAVVKREWEFVRRERARDDSYRKLRAQYQVIFKTGSKDDRP
jgi:hypothetical protein